MTDPTTARYEAYLDFQQLVDGGRVQPGWVLGGPSFWYAEGGPQDRVIQLVDPVADTTQPLFDVERLRKALTQALGYEPAGKGVPFATLQLVAPQVSVFSVEGVTFSLDLETYALTRLPARTTLDIGPVVSEAGRTTPRVFSKETFQGVGPVSVPESTAPDGSWFASVADGNIALRASIDGRSIRLTQDGSAEVFWDVETVKCQPWSPDSQRLAVFKHDTRCVPRVPTIHWLKPLEQVEECITLPAGCTLPRTELFVLDVLGGMPVHIDLGDTTDEFLAILGWLPDASELIVARYDRLFTGITILAADPASGSTRTVMSERSDTWLTNHHEYWSGSTGFTMLPDGSGFLWRSQRDGQAHLYRYSFTGELIARLTSGDFPVTGVTRIDQANGWVYLQAHADPARPYDNHLYRVRLEGGELQQLTRGEGRHTISLAPSADYFVDVWSGVATPPRSELRSVEGELLQVLSEADISRLEQAGWTPSKEYVVKAADGVTDLWVTLHFPGDFDPGRKYPLVEHIYGGPQMMQRVMEFGDTPVLSDAAPVVNYPRALAQQGFVVLTMDGRGTPGRSKAFHDASYRNWGGFEIADHAGAITQLAEREGFIDLDRVAVMGGSWGGQYTFRALAQAPEVYGFGIAEVPGYDSRSFILYEPYLGMPADNRELYDDADALRLAPRLRGKLLQTGGVNDTATQKDFFKMSENLIRLGIQHDTMIYPNAGHGYIGASGSYNNDLKTTWLRKHLLP